MELNEDFFETTNRGVENIDDKPAVATALHPTVGTVKPSAMLAVVGVKIGLPALSALTKLGHLSGSTP